MRHWSKDIILRIADGDCLGGLKLDGVCSDWHCQSKVEYFARTPTSYFAAIDFPIFFRIEPRGSMTTSSIRNFSLTMPKHWLARATGCLFSKAKTDIHSDGNRLPSALNIVMAVLKAE